MYEVNFVSQLSYMSNYFYCQIRSEKLLYDAERDLLAIATFLVILGMRPDINWLCAYSIGRLGESTVYE